MAFPITVYGVTVTKVETVRPIFDGREARIFFDDGTPEGGSERVWLSGCAIACGFDLAIESAYQTSHAIKRASAYLGKDMESESPGDVGILRAEVSKALGL